MRSFPWISATCLICNTLMTDLAEIQFSVPQVEYPLGGSSKKGSHVYLLL